MTQTDQPSSAAQDPNEALNPAADEITKALLALDAEEGSNRFASILEQQAAFSAEPLPAEAGEGGSQAVPARLDLAKLLDQPDLLVSLTKLLVEKFKLPEILAQILAEAVLSKTAKKKTRRKPRRKASAAQPKKPTSSHKPRRRPKTSSTAKKKASAAKPKKTTSSTAKKTKPSVSSAKKKTTTPTPKRTAGG